MRNAWRRFDRFSARPPAAVLLAVVALGVWVVQAAGWPMQRGRDAWDYLVYYLSFADAETPFQLVMLMRSPVTALALGAPLDLGGARALEAVAALSFAVTVVAWAAVARRYSAVAAVLTVLLFFAHPTFSLPFHEAASDFVASTLFALYAYAVVRALERPSEGRFALVGLLVALLALARPAYQALVLGAVLPLLAQGPLRARLLRTLAFGLVAVLPLVGWAVHNGVRYGDTTVSRAGKYNIPFYTAFRDGEIERDNGPASRRLARLIERDVLTLPPYRDLGVDVATYLDTRSNFEAVRLAGLADRVDGVGSDYALLRAAAREVPRGDGLRLAGVDVERALDGAWRLSSQTAARELRLKSDVRPEPAPSVPVGGRRVPNPAVLGIPEGAEPYGFLACAVTEIAPCILDEPAARYADAGLARRYTEITDRVRELDSKLGVRERNQWVADRIAGVVRRQPPPWLWAVVALAALALRRPRNSLALAWLVLAPLGILVVHAIGVGPDLYYALPVLPALTTAAACALTGARRPSATGTPGARRTSPGRSAG